LATSTPAPSLRPALKNKPATNEETYSPEETAIIVESAGGHLITEIFPGAKEI
jgi:hypothetical protein